MSSRPDPTTEPKTEPDARPPRGATDPRGVAQIAPYAARALLGLAESRGLSAIRLCRGLGFSVQDLMNREHLLSHRQVSALVRRVRQSLGDQVPIGLAAGARQTPLSWGLPGLAMLTCETLGEAVGYGLAHQDEAGAMLDHVLTVHGREAYLDVHPRIFDLALEPFLVEDSFAGAVAICRYLVGDAFQPLRVDLAFASDPHAANRRRFYRCPVRFGSGASRMVFEAHWLEARLPHHDRFTAGLVRAQLSQLLTRPIGRPALAESLASRLRQQLDEPPRQRELAQAVNISERTLRRRLDAQDTSFRALRDDARYERARDLLAHTTMNMGEVAQAVGYADARAFRRAFKRWSGQLPTAFREGL